MIQQTRKQYNKGGINHVLEQENNKKLKKVDRGYRRSIDKSYRQSIEYWMLSMLSEDQKEAVKNNKYDIVEYFMDLYREEFIIIDNEIYEILDIKGINNKNVFKPSNNEDGTINFETCYYNGKMSFERAIEKTFYKGIEK